jgi:hypothetical protein
MVKITTNDSGVRTPATSRANSITLFRIGAILRHVGQRPSVADRTRTRRARSTHCQLSPQSYFLQPPSVKDCCAPPEYNRAERKTHPAPSEPRENRRPNLHAARCPICQQELSGHNAWAGDRQFGSSSARDGAWLFEIRVSRFSPESSSGGSTAASDIYAPSGVRAGVGQGA